MKLFLAYLLGMFALGLLTRRKKRAKVFAITLGACLLVCFGYFFLHQI